MPKIIPRAPNPAPIIPAVGIGATFVLCAATLPVAVPELAVLLAAATVKEVRAEVSAEGITDPVVWVALAEEVRNPESSEERVRGPERLEEQEW